MAPKMVANFRRSLSFSNHIPSCSSSKPPKKYPYHVRSVSLPCRSHPLISQLRDEITELKTWASKHDARTSAWLCDGLTQLRIVQESLDDLLQLPQTRESLLGYDHGLIEKFLDDLLRFLDVYGIFQTLMMTLKEQHLAAQVAVRRKDDCKMSLHLKNFRKMGKEFGQLASSLQSMGKFKPSPPQAGRTVLLVAEEDAEIDQVIRDVIEITASVSVALFNGLSVSLASRKPSCLKFSLKNSSKMINAKKVVMVQQQQEGIQEFEEMSLESLRRKDEEELRWTSKKMHELEDCIGGIENGSERVFRSLFNTRVSLLNVLTAL